MVKFVYLEVIRAKDKCIKSKEMENLVNFTLCE